jgi:RHS repeat-associated protein
VISKLNGVAFDSHTLTPDPVGNITQETITNAGGTQQNTFGYDDLYRLQTASVGGVASSWVYDNNGNRTSQTVGGVTTSYTPDDANRLIAVNGVTVTNDANGSVTGDGTKTYSWDVRGRLVGMTGPGLTASFVSDYLGRRVSKTINGTPTTFLNDGADLVSEITGSGASQTLHGPILDEPLARDGLFFTPNHLGSTTTLTDMSGVVQQSYQYSPFGETTGNGSVANPFQFTGRENDGTGLMYYRARYYMPAWGRFASEDPIGLGDGLNQYAYANNNPVFLADPFGLWATGSYFGDVGQVLAGYGDNLNPLNWYLGARALFEIAQNCGLGAAGGALLSGLAHGYSDWLTSTDPRTFGRSFGTVLATAAGATAPFARGAAAATRFYSARVLIRGAEETGPYHNFPGSFDEIILSGERTVVSNDYVLYTKPGSINGVDGTFQIGVRPSRSGRIEVITHRFFKPSRR